MRLALIALLATASAGATTAHAPLTAQIDLTGKMTLSTNAPAGTQVVIHLHSKSGAIYTTVAKQAATFTVTADGVWTLDANY